MGCACLTPWQHNIQRSPSLLTYLGWGSPANVRTTPLKRKLGLILFAMWWQLRDDSKQGCVSLGKEIRKVQKWHVQLIPLYSYSELIERLLLSGACLSFVMALHQPRRSNFLPALTLQCWNHCSAAYPCSRNVMLEGHAGLNPSLATGECLGGVVLCVSLIPTVPHVLAHPFPLSY